MIFMVPPFLSHEPHHSFSLTDDPVEEILTRQRRGWKPVGFQALPMCGATHTSLTIEYKRFGTQQSVTYIMENVHNDKLNLAIQLLSCGWNSP